MANLRISELDFENIKKNLKAFLTTYKNNDGDVIFSDYEFEGSSLSILIDLLAYNTHYNAYMTNMLANEMFLDSAVKRESTVSIAKHLGYVPASTVSARAILTFDVLDPANDPATLTLERFTIFNTIIGNTVYNFVNLDPVTIESRNGSYTFTDVELVEGTPLEISYRVSNPGPSEKFEIPNDNVDITTLKVLVQNSFTDTTTEAFFRNDDIAEAASTSNIFYVEEDQFGKYVIHFGDGVLGKKLTSGNIVRIQYLVSNGSVCNVAGNIQQTFTTSAKVADGTIVSPILARRNSTGGSDRETVESIKFNAPKFFATYNRAVTASDYKAIIKKRYPFVESIAAWGGETNVPPKYGKVILSLKPYTGYVISDAIKQQIAEDILSSRSVMAIRPEFVDPEYIYIGINSEITFDKNVAARSDNFIRSSADSVIRNYFARNLQQFDNDFVYSRLTRLIDESDTSIIGNLTKLHIQRRIRPVVNQQNIYANENSIKFNNPIVRQTLRSTSFNFSVDDVLLSCKLADRSISFESDIGAIDIVNFDGTEVVLENIGSINYSTGELTMVNFFFNGYSDNASDIRINVEPDNLNIQAQNNQILVLDDSAQNTNILKEAGLRITMIGR